MWPQRRADRRRRTGRGLRAAIASVLLPGAGQLLLGRRGKGALLVCVAIAIGVSAGWLWTRDTTTLASWAVHPGVLLWLLGVNLAVALFRLYATFDAYAEGVRPPARPALPRRAVASFGVTGALLLIAAVVIVPHAAVGYYAATTHDLLQTVFVVDDDPPPTTTPPPDVAQPEEPTEALEDDPPVEQPVEVNPWTQAGRVTIALLGSDAGVGRAGDRIDGLLVVTVDTETGDAALFSVDRYLADFPLPDRIAEPYAEHCPYGEGWRYLNALYRCGHERAPEEFAAAYPNAQDPAAAAVVDVLSGLLGIGIPHYAMVDMAGFVAVVDALGGVELDLTSPLRVRISPSDGGAWHTIDLPAGPQVVDGEEALAYARVRERDGGDADRMRRQRCLVSSVIRTADVGSVLRGFPTVSAAVEEHVETSIPLRLLPDLIELVPSMDADRVVAVGFGPPDYRGWDHRPDVARIQARVRQVLDDPATATETGTTTEIGATVCR